VVADFLKVDLDAIDPRMPLALYGLDSVGSMELVAALEIALGRELPEWLLLEHPDLEALSKALEDVQLKPDATTTTSVTTVASGFSWTSAALSQMLADSLLPADVRPPDGPITPAEGRVLLTGATGFLGAYLLRDLLEATSAEIWCLVRGTESEAYRRVTTNLERYGLKPQLDGRIQAICGDLTLPTLGLSAAHYQELSEAVDAI